MRARELRVPDARVLWPELFARWLLRPPLPLLAGLELPPLLARLELPPLLARLELPPLLRLAVLRLGLAARPRCAPAPGLADELPRWLLERPREAC